MTNDDNHDYDYETTMTMSRHGQLSIEILIFSAVALVMVTGFVLWIDSLLNLSLRDVNKTDAFSIAEAGLEYYRWHLAHNTNDYRDGQGTSTPGPYVHNYYDKDGKLLGTFSLAITPPLLGSTVVTINSTGKTVADPFVQKTAQAKMGIQSFAKYAFLLNADVRFGAGTDIFGQVHSNGGIHFDAIAHNLVTSAQSTYDDPDHSGSNEFGVHTHTPPVDPIPPTSTPSRPDVFLAGRQFPVPAVDFNVITQNLSQIKTDAQTSGYYATSSGTFGYEIVLRTDGKFDLYKVTSLANPPGSCSNSGNQSGWGTWSVNGRTLVTSTTIPSNGLIFVEDNVWVRGQINNARLTIASGKFPDNPSTRTSVTVNSDLLYTNYNGTDVIGLIAQNNFNVGMVSSSTFRIDAAITAQNGRAGRYYYSSNCSPYDTRSTLTLYGMIASSQRYGFAYTDGTGYATRNINYDANLLYGPPPSYPFSGTTYTQISWDEVK